MATLTSPRLLVFSSVWPAFAESLSTLTTVLAAVEHVRDTNDTLANRVSPLLHLEHLPAQSQALS